MDQSPRFLDTGDVNLDVQCSSGQHPSHAGCVMVAPGPEETEADKEASKEERQKGEDSDAETGSVEFDNSSPIKSFRAIECSLKS